jgi:putative phosphoribosyl transferase
MPMVYSSEMIVHDNEYTAHLLAQKVMRYKCRNSVIVGVGHRPSSIGLSLAKELNLPFDVVLCREIKHPADARKTIGSVSDGVVVMNNTITHDIPQDYIYRQVVNLKNQIENDYKRIYSHQAKPSFRSKTVIPVADMLTAPESVLAGILTIKAQEPSQVIVVAAPTHVATLPLKLVKLDAVVAGGKGGEWLIEALIDKP